MGKKDGGNNEVTTCQPRLKDELISSNITSLSDMFRSFEKFRKIYPEAIFFGDTSSGYEFNGMLDNIFQIIQ
jgi:hypothetical protein